MPVLSDIIGLWPSVETFAADAGVSVSLVRVWKFRKSIPADRWSRIEQKAAERNIAGATASDMAQLLANAAEGRSDGGHRASV